MILSASRRRLSDTNQIHSKDIVGRRLNIMIKFMQHGLMLTGTIRLLPCMKFKILRDNNTVLGRWLFVCHACIHLVLAPFHGYNIIVKAFMDEQNQEQAGDLQELEIISEVFFTLKQTDSPSAAIATIHPDKFAYAIDRHKTQLTHSSSTASGADAVDDGNLEMDDDEGAGDENENDGHDASRRNRQRRGPRFQVGEMSKLLDLTMPMLEQVIAAHGFPPSTV